MSAPKHTPGPHPLDAAIRELTAYGSFAEMMADAVRSGDNGYRPTCRVDLDPRYGEIADAYDAEAKKLKMRKRAYRPNYEPRVCVACCLGQHGALCASHGCSCCGARQASAVGAP